MARASAFAVALCGLWLVAAGAHAQGSAEAEKSVDIVRTDNPPVIDGSLDDPAWADAAVIKDFHQIEPVDGAPPSDPVEVYLLYDRDALYIGARIYDSEPQNISAKILRQGTQGFRDEDRFAVVLDPLNARRSGYRYEVNANGVYFDGLYRGAQGGFETNWDSIWHAASQRFDQGWTTEIVIPMKSISFDPANDTWAMNFSRAIRRRGEEAVWVSRNRSINPSIVGEVRGFHDLDQGVGLDVVPSVSMTRQRKFDPSHTNNNFDPSLDIFYKVTPSLNAALTFNTDFSATEVDDRQVNLTRFSLFFPEKRAFFLQDTDVFEFGGITSSGLGTSNIATGKANLENGRPFFSRSIGLSSTGDPVSLDYGGKISGRIGRWSIGGLGVHQARSIDSNASNLLVLRGSANILAESDVGFIATSGSPQSNLSNHLFGADFRYRNSRMPGGGVLEAESFAMQSKTEGLDGRDRAWGLSVRMPNNAGLNGGFGYKEIQENFNPALGFVSRRGIRDYRGNIGYTHYFRNSFLRSLSTGWDAFRSEYLDGGLQTQSIWFKVWQEQLVSRDEPLWPAVILQKEVLREPFTIYQDETRSVVIPVGEYSFTNYSIRMQSAQQRALSATMFFDWGDFYSGTKRAYRPSVTWRPSPHFNTTAALEWTKIDLPQGKFISRLMRLNTVVAFNSRWSWVNLVQYDNISEVLGINSRLVWVPEQGREAFFVINHNMQDRNKDNVFQSELSELTVKFNYTFRF